MKSKFEERDKAQELRKQGLSFREIRKIIPVSKSSLSTWLRYLPLTEEQEKQLEDRARINIDNGRERAALSNRKKRIGREDIAMRDARILFEKFGNDPIFILGIGLYWAEGAKRTSAFQFVNSDSEMVCFMIHWTEKYFGFPKDKIFLRLSTHKDFILEKYEDFWSKTTGISLENFKKTTYKPNRHGVFKKNPHYKGCIRLEIGGGMKNLRIMLSLQKILAERIKML